MFFLILIAMIVWTTARHEGSHALAAWLQGSAVEEMRLLPGYRDDVGFYFGYVIHSGPTSWITDAAPFFADLALILASYFILRRMSAGRPRTWVVLLGLVSPLIDLAYNYQGGLWRAGTDVHDLFLELPDAWVHGYFLVAIGGGLILFRKISAWRRQRSPGPSEERA